MAKGDEVFTLFPKQFETEPLLSAELTEQLRMGLDIQDYEFDQIFPPYYKFQSTIHWSPVIAARQIADWIVPLGLNSFIDVGCGVGKLCFLLRILTGYKITGIEQRPKLVAIANKIIDVNNFKDISVVQMNMLDLNWDKYDIYYLYNPFQEHVTDEGLCIIENDLEFDRKNYVYYTSEVFRQLSWAKKGKVLITFHGYGGSVPPSWRMVASRHIESGDLTMWIKE
ncbi:Methyltransferase domain protein [compost metagenome]